MISKRSGAFAAVLAALFALMLALNAYTPLMMDDYDYSFSWATGERLAGVMDIFASQWAHYAIWGGRSVTHFLAQLFLYLGKPVFNIANALMGRRFHGKRCLRRTRCCFSWCRFSA